VSPIRRAPASILGLQDGADWTELAGGQRCAPGHVPGAAQNRRMRAADRSFVLRGTRLRAVPGLEAIRLHLADEVLPLWRAVGIETGEADPAIPYWAFAWAGGLALARYLLERPEVVAGRRVLDLASGSGLCAIAAALSGGAEVAAVDVDPRAIAATELNARAAGVRVDTLQRDILDEAPPDVDVVLAGDTWYEAGFARRVLPWLERANSAGIDVLVGDPGRRYLPTDRLELLATYEVRTTTELEDLAQKTGSVYRLARPG
jgi:predicted nicotinamide N-methyase